MIKHKLRQMILIGALGLGLGSVTSCSQEAKQGLSHSERIIGLWEWTDVDRGTIFRAQFQENNRLMEIFQASSGYTRERPKEWRLQGDTLILTDQMGNDSLRIVSLQDTLMELERLGDKWPLQFRRVKP